MSMLIFFNKTKLFENEHSNIFAVALCSGQGTVQVQCTVGYAPLLALRVVQNDGHR